jgi:hypothetical protein
MFCKLLKSQQQQILSARFLLKITSYYGNKAVMHVLSLQHGSMLVTVATSSMKTCITITGQGSKLCVHTCCLCCVVVIVMMCVKL